ncbi:hypothetical protein [Ferrovibrio sp.]|uniref:hypothetical protein n=1 Tax=Ferrovibrio sp. TaxID=1917215 RepID=UPI002632AC38|nr:hypothetical protein [Ferrovibrio sp.]
MKTAARLYQTHGRQGLRVAANRASKLAQEGDRGGAMEWLLISEAVQQIIQEKETPDAGT